MWTLKSNSESLSMISEHVSEDILLISDTLAKLVFWKLMAEQEGVGDDNL
jgi:hypothetical protein